MNAPFFTKRIASIRELVCKHRDDFIAVPEPERDNVSEHALAAAYAKAEREAEITILKGEVPIRCRQNHRRIKDTLAFFAHRASGEIGVFAAGWGWNWGIGREGIFTKVVSPEGCGDIDAETCRGITRGEVVLEGPPHHCIVVAFHHADLDRLVLTMELEDFVEMPSHWGEVFTWSRTHFHEMPSCSY